MNWRDLLYFSKGERRALTLLLCLIAASQTILLLTDEKNNHTPNNDRLYEPVKTIQDSPANSPEPEKVKTPAPPRKNYSFRKKNKLHPGASPNTSQRKTFPKTEKYPAKTVVELNTADTTILKKVPGIGSTFARRIIKYRELLGGFYTVEQLREVYGIDEERYNAMKPWFSTDKLIICKLFVNKSSVKKHLRHPYINKQQAHIIEQLQKQKGKLTGWEDLQLLEEFTETDKERLTPYLSFE